MSDQYSRRSFLSGVLACGVLSAGAIRLHPAGRDTSRNRTITLTLVTGEDPTGARSMLIDLWHETYPDIRIDQREIRAGSGREREEMLLAAENQNANLLNLDVVDVAHFANRELITPVRLKTPVGFPAAIRSLHQNREDSSRYDAVPFNADIGMLFTRFGPTERHRETMFLEAIEDASTSAGRRKFSGQLDLGDTGRQEAFVVNVLEHALLRDGQILNDDPELLVNRDLEAWNSALAPLRDLLEGDGVVTDEDEGASLDSFRRDESVRYMRNWPVKYWELLEADQEGRAARIGIDQLSTGILGGQSLAIVADTPHAEEAQRFIEFMVSRTPQKILATHGFAPTRTDTYSERDLLVIIPHLRDLLGALERGHPRPRHANYRRFSDAVAEHVSGYLAGGDPLSKKFIDDINRALG